MTAPYAPIKLTSFTPLHDGVIVSDMIFTERFSAAGIFIPNDDKTVQGVRPRWAKVYAVGAEQEDIKVGQWICVAHGRWTRGITIEDATGEHVIRRVDNDDILLISDEPVVDETMGQPL